MYPKKKKMRKELSCKLLIGILACVMLNPISALARTKINSVGIKLTAEDYDEEFGAVIDAESKSEDYSVESIETYDEYNGISEDEEEEDVDFDDEEGGTTSSKKKAHTHDNRFYITLSTSDENYFNTTTAKSIHVSGLGATFVSASRRDNGTTLIVAVDVKHDTILGAPNEIQADEEFGFVKWEPVHAADWYRIKVIDPNGKSNTISTICNRYNLTNMFTMPGNYEVSYSPRAASGKTTGESDTITISVSEEQAAAIAASIGVEKVVSYKDGIRSPGNMIIEYVGAGWQQMPDGRWWYRRNDGTYPQGEVLNELGAPDYFFDKHGYLVTNDTVVWKGVEYKADENGKLTPAATE